MTVVRILGSGTLLPDASRSSAAHLVEGEGFRVLLDCGSGTLHGLARHTVAWPGLTHVAVSHYHLDHVGATSLGFSSPSNTPLRAAERSR